MRSRSPMAREQSESGAPRPAPTRRGLLRIGAGALGAFALSGLAGCATSGRGTGQTLDFWHLMSGSDGERMMELVQGYNGSTDGAKFRQTVLAWGEPYYTKLAMSSAGGRAPTLAVMHATRVPGYAEGSLLDSWDAELFAELGVAESDFPERIWRKGVIDGKLRSIALDTHPFVLHYNREIAEKADALGPDGLLSPPRSPEEFREMAERMREVTGARALSYGYLNDFAQMWRMFYTFYSQLGGTIELPQGKRMRYDEDAAVRALEWIRSLLDGKLGGNSHDGGTALSEFVAGKSGMLFGGVWEITALQAEGVPFDTAIIPGVFGRTIAYGDSHVFVLPHQDDPDPAERRAAHEFVASLLKSSVDWAKAGHIPAYNPVTASPEYEKLVPQSHYADAVDYLVYDPEAWFSGTATDFQTYFGDTIQRVLSGHVAPVDGIRAFASRIDKLLSRPSPV